MGRVKRTENGPRRIRCHRCGAKLTERGDATTCGDCKSQIHLDLITGKLSREKGIYVPLETPEDAELEVNLRFERDGCFQVEDF